MRTWFTVDVLGDAKLCAKVDGDSFNNTTDDFQVFLECFSFRYPFFFYLSTTLSFSLLVRFLCLRSIYHLSILYIYIYVDNNSRILVLLILFEFEQSFDSCKSISIIKLNCNR